MDEYGCRLTLQTPVSFLLSGFERARPGAALRLYWACPEMAHTLNSRGYPRTAKTPSPDAVRMRAKDREGHVGSDLRKSTRGFASMSLDKQREIASKGGRAAHLKGTAHQWTSEEARAAGRKGGQISRGGRGRLVHIPAAEQSAPVPRPGMN